MTRAVENGWAKLKIEAAAAEKQARIDSGHDVIVGVNKFKLEHEDPMDVREIDNTAVRESQLTRLAQVRAQRDSAAVQAALAAITEAARSETGNLLDLAIKAVRARATVGEVSDALEKVWGRHRAVTQSVSGVYGAQFAEDTMWEKIKADIDAFAAAEGRRPRIMVAKVGQDGHDRGAKVVATAFADLGFDVDIGPLFQTPEEAARQAIENDVHAIGISTLAAGHKTLVPAIIDALRKQGAGEIVVFVGGVVPRAGLRDALQGGAVGGHLRPRHRHSGVRGRRAREDSCCAHAGRQGLSAPASLAMRVPEPDPQECERLCAGVRGGDRRALAKAITLAESTRADHQALARAMMANLLPATGGGLRMGISGAPGVGKSTLIEALGLHLVEEGHHVAVLAVDPSSSISGGSILGDKTRMEELSRQPHAFIRPSPARRCPGRRRRTHARGHPAGRGGGFRYRDRRDGRRRPRAKPTSPT